MESRSPTPLHAGRKEAEKQFQKCAESLLESAPNTQRKKDMFLISNFLHFDNCVECCGHVTLLSVSCIYFCPHLGEINCYRQNILSFDCPYQGQVFFYVFHIIIGIQQLLSAGDVCSVFGWQELSYLSDNACTSKQQCCTAAKIQGQKKFCGLNK